MIKIYEAPYAGWDKCLFMENGIIQIVITLEVGPRIIRYSFIDGENMFCEKEDHIGTVGGDEWKVYGGHRLWAAPEVHPRTYVADNFPVKYTVDGTSVTVTPDAEELARIQKEMVITMAEDSSRVTVEHRITNIGAWDVDLAAWAITVCDKGSLEVIPEPDKYHQYQPNRRIALWAYTDLNDPRVYWGEKFITVNNDPKNQKIFKIGTDNQQGWIGFFNKDCLFINRYPVEPDAVYPDLGVSFETYCCDFMTECETLSPLYHLPPNATAVHVEEWELFKESRPDAKDEDAIKKIMDKYI